MVSKQPLKKSLHNVFWRDQVETESWLKALDRGDKARALSKAKPNPKA